MEDNQEMMKMMKGMMEKAKMMLMMSICNKSCG
jgi:hypothetical protein